MIDGKMNDEPYQIGKFSHSLRCHLLEEHLGPLGTGNEVPELNVEHPLADGFGKGISKQAIANTLIYETVFRSKVFRTNQVRNFVDLENWKARVLLTWIKP